MRHIPDGQKGWSSTSSSFKMFVITITTNLRKQETSPTVKHGRRSGDFQARVSRTALNWTFLNIVWFYTHFTWIEATLVGLRLVKHLVSPKLPPESGNQRQLYHFMIFLSQFSNWSVPSSKNRTQTVLMSVDCDSAVRLMPPSHGSVRSLVILSPPLLGPFPLPQPIGFPFHQSPPPFPPVDEMSMGATMNWCCTYILKLPRISPTNDLCVWFLHTYNIRKIHFTKSNPFNIVKVFIKSGVNRPKLERCTKCPSVGRSLPIVLYTH